MHLLTVIVFSIFPPSAKHRSTYTSCTHMHTLPSLLVLHYWRQLLVISDQDKSLGVEQGSQTDGLTDLWRLVYDAEIKPPTCENGMLDAHTGGSHYQLEKEGIGIEWEYVFSFNLNVLISTTEMSWNRKKNIEINSKMLKKKVVVIIIFHKQSLHLLVIKLLQLWESVNPLLPGTFLGVR